MQNMFDFYNRMISDDPQELQNMFSGQRPKPAIGLDKKVRTIILPETDKASLILAIERERDKIDAKAAREARSKKRVKHEKPIDERKKQQKKPKGPSREDRIAALEGLSSRAEDKVAALRSAISAKVCTLEHDQERLDTLETLRDEDVALIDEVLADEIGPLIETFSKTTRNLSNRAETLFRLQQIDQETLKSPLSRPDKPIICKSSGEKSDYIQDGIVDEIDAALRGARDLSGEDIVATLEKQKSIIIDLGTQYADLLDQHTEIKQAISAFEIWHSQLDDLYDAIDIRRQQIELALSVAK